MRLKIVFFFIAACCIISARAQKLTIQSPKQKISALLFNQENRESGQWYLKTSYSSNGNISAIIPMTAVNTNLLFQTQKMAEEWENHSLPNKMQ